MFIQALTPKGYGGEGEIDYQQWFHMPHKKTGKLEPLRRTKIAMGRPVVADDSEGKTKTGESSLTVSGEQAAQIKNGIEDKMPTSGQTLKMPLYRFPVNDQQRYGIFPFSKTVEFLRGKVMRGISITLWFCFTRMAAIASDSTRTKHSIWFLARPLFPFPLVFLAHMC